MTQKSPITVIVLICLCAFISCEKYTHKYVTEVPQKKVYSWEKEKPDYVETELNVITLQILMFCLVERFLFHVSS